MVAIPILGPIVAMFATGGFLTKKVNKIVDEMIENGVEETSGKIRSLTSTMFKNQMKSMGINLLVILSAFSTKYFIPLEISILCVSFAYIFILIKLAKSFLSQIIELRDIFGSAENRSHASKYNINLKSPNGILFYKIYNEVKAIVKDRYSKTRFLKRWIYKVSHGKDLVDIATKITQDSLPKAWISVVSFIVKSAIRLACYWAVSYYLILPLRFAHTQLSWWETYLYPFLLAFQTLYSLIAGIL